MRSRGISCFLLAKRSRDLSDVACTLASASRNSWMAASIRSRLRLNSSLLRSTWDSRTGISAAQHFRRHGEVEAVERLRPVGDGEVHRAVAERHAAVDADLGAGD